VAVSCGRHGHWWWEFRNPARYPQAINRDRYDHW